MLFVKRSTANICVFNFAKIDDFQLVKQNLNRRPKKGKWPNNCGIDDDLNKIYRNEHVGPSRMAVRAHRPSSVSTKLIARKTAFRLLLTEFSLSKLPIPFFHRYARRNFHALSQTLPEIFCIPPCIHENEMFGTGCEVHNIGGSPSRLNRRGFTDLDLTWYPSYVQEAHFRMQRCSSNGKNSTSMSQLLRKIPWLNQTTSPVWLTITFVLMTAELYCGSAL